MEGRPFKGELNSADASTGLAVPLYESGSLSAYTLLGNEYLEIHTVSVVTATGGDTFLFTGADNSPAAGEYVVRGSYAANGGIAGRLVPPHVGGAGHTLWIDAIAGAIDVLVRGTIRKIGDDTTVQPTWKAK